MEITAALVKELRERTGAGMMECKKVLVETNGDIDAAIESMRKSGAAKADKKAGRTAAEGVIAVAVSADGKQVAAVEVNCETDFVSKGDEFVDMANNIAKQVLAGKPADVDAALELPFGDGNSIGDTVKNLIAKLGENMGVRRFEILDVKGTLGVYQHGSRIGVLVDLVGGDESTAKDIAMHIAASRPVCVSDEQVDQALIEKEKEIFAAQAAESGKPADIIAKMVDGRIAKFLKEVTLLGQPFVKNPDETVEKVLKGLGASVNTFVRLEVGEGIEKKKENFADEVMAQARGK